MRQGRCFEAVRQTCEALMFTEMVVYVDRVFDEGVKPIDSRFLSRGERALQG